MLMINAPQKAGHIGEGDLVPARVAVNLCAVFAEGEGLPRTVSDAARAIAEQHGKQNQRQENGKQPFSPPK